MHQAAFFDAVLEEDIPLMEKLLAQYPEYLDITDDLGTARSALMDAAVNGKEDAAIWLIEKGCDITIGENSGYSPLDAAAYRGSTKLVAALLKAGLDPYRPGPRVTHQPSPAHPSIQPALPPADEHLPHGRAHDRAILGLFVGWIPPDASRLLLPPVRLISTLPAPRKAESALLVLLPLLPALLQDNSCGHRSD